MALSPSAPVTLARRVRLSPLSLASLRRGAARRRQLFLYAAFGGIGALVDIGVFAAGIYLVAGFDKSFATALSSTVATTVTFVLNSRYNFRVGDRVLLRYLSYLAVSAVGIGVTVALFAIFVDWLSLPVMLVKVGALGVVFVVQYTLNRTITFIDQGRIVEIRRLLEARGAPLSESAGS